MLLLICTLMLTALTLLIFTFSGLSTVDAPKTKPVKVKVVEEEEETEDKKTPLGRPIKIVMLNE
jgi:hypothetical protein